MASALPESHVPWNDPEANAVQSAARSTSLPWKRGDVGETRWSWTGQLARVDGSRGASTAPGFAPGERSTAREPGQPDAPCVCWLFVGAASDACTGAARGPPTGAFSGTPVS